MYSEKVMQRFKDPKNAGELRNANGTGKVGNPACLTSKTLIVSKPQINKIMELRKNGQVLSHKGIFCKVTKKFVRKYKGMIYVLDVWNLGKLQITPEHNVFAAKIDCSRDKFKHHKEATIDWFAAEQLRKGDYILYPIPKQVIDKKHIKFDIPTPKYDFKSKKLPLKIKVNNKFLKIAGFYLAEGHVRIDKCKGTLVFSFGSHEEEYIKEVIILMKNVFGLDYSKIYKRPKNSTDIVYYSARLARFFNEQFGKGAKNKHLPSWIVTLPPSKQKAILSGLWQGDGYVSAKMGKFVTISEQLAYQTVLLLLRQKILFSFLVYPERGMHKKHYSVYIKEQDSLKKMAKLMKKEIKFHKMREPKHRAWYSDDYLYVPIRKISSEQFFGLVHNLEVEKSHSYTTSCAAVHNCGDVMKVEVRIKDNIIKDARFKTFGCCAAIAASDAVCELVKGKTVEEALSLTKQDVVEHLGGLPDFKVHCSILGIDALKAAVRDYQEKQK